jgi:hypothetical protein
MHGLTRRDGDKAAICRDSQRVEPFTRDMKTFLNVALAADLHKPAVIPSRPDGLAIGTGLHGQHATFVALNQCFAQLHHPVAKAKGRAITNPSGTNSRGRIWQGPFLPL